MKELLKSILAGCAGGLSVVAAVAYACHSVEAAFFIAMLSSAIWGFKSLMEISRPTL